MEWGVRCSSALSPNAELLFYTIAGGGNKGYPWLTVVLYVHATHSLFPWDPVQVEHPPRTDSGGLLKLAVGVGMGWNSVQTSLNYLEVPSFVTLFVCSVRKNNSNSLNRMNGVMFPGNSPGYSDR